MYCTIVFAQEAGTLKITVVDKADKPVAGADVFLVIHPDTARQLRTVEIMMKALQTDGLRTNEQGIAQATTDADKFYVFVRKKGYKHRLNYYAELAPGAWSTLKIVLEKTDSAIILGKVTDIENGAPLLGANIRIEGTKIGTASGPEGIYSLAKVPPGLYNIIVRFLGYEPVESKISVKAGDTAFIGFVMKKDKANFETIKLEGKVFKLRREYLQTKDEDKREKIREQMRDLLYKIFDEKEEKSANLISDLREKLAGLEKLQAQRKKNRDKIVERRLQEMFDIEIFELAPKEKN
jgi:hypothetical protein